MSIRVAAKQSVVCALHHGHEEHYALGEKIAAAMFQPILRMHRITVEQMAILEPAIVETTTASLLYACKEAMDQGIAMGIPEAAARDFVLGHLRVELAIVFGESRKRLIAGRVLRVSRLARISAATRQGVRSVAAAEARFENLDDERQPVWLVHS